MIFTYDKNDCSEHYIVADVIEDYIDDDKEVIMELTLCSRHCIYNIII